MVKQKEKLIWLGIKRAAQNVSGASSDIDRLRKNVGGYDTFQSDLDNVSSQSEMNTYLQNNGFDQSQADNFISKINNNFTDEDSSGDSFDEFKTYVQNESDAYSELKSHFDSQSSFSTDLETEDGEKAGGIRVFENDGVTYDGVDVPAGAVEVFGKEVHFSQSGTPKQGDGSSSTGGDAAISVDNMHTDAQDNTVTIGDSLTFSADVTNNGDYPEYFIATFIESGDIIDVRNMFILSGKTTTVEFTITKYTTFTAEYEINLAGPIEATWEPYHLPIK